MIFDTLQTVLAFVVTLGILVSIHEFGHYWVARRCGIKVLRFSVGFGKSLWSRTDKHGTEFSVAAIPLGGYVKMLDEREGPVADNEKHLSFNAQSVLARIAVVAAGPAANFLLAIAALCLMYLLGVRTVVPQIGSVQPESAAWEAGLKSGDEIVAVDGTETSGWQAINMELLSSIGDSRSIVFSVRSGEPGSLPEGGVRDVSVSVSNWLVGEEQPSPIRDLGIIPYSPEIPAIIGQLVDDGAAKLAGVKTGDKILAADEIPVKDWMDWVKTVRARPDQTINIRIDRGGQELTLELTPASKTENDLTFGYIGAGVQSVSWPDALIRDIRLGPFDAVVEGAKATWNLTSMTLESLWKMVVGLVSVKNLSGPITIAKVAGASLESGLENFLYFLAMLSVSLGVLNLLPIPVLDGGHLLFYMVELVRGKPLSEKIQMLGVKIGVTLVLGVMMLAMYNDLSRLFQ